MKRITLAVIAATLAATASPALAQTPTPTQAPAPTQQERGARFDAGDKDHDGKMTKAEFFAHLPAELKTKAEDLWAHYNPAKKASLTRADYLTVPPMSVTLTRPQ